VEASWHYTEEDELAGHFLLRSLTNRPPPVRERFGNLRECYPSASAFRALPCPRKGLRPPETSIPFESRDSFLPE
jgi:hypothetical protein